ncbi:hypothetical protein [Mucilaginibacter sp.]|uniref:hypothetical protein n=1 Tax=Mucilaginibacter sp. TaxID=1882438 RepID=UPI0035BBB779
MDKTLVKKEFAGKTSPVQKDCKGCSPFFSCGACAGFIITAPVVHLFTPVEQSIKHTASYQHPFLQQIALAIWQPPQLG